MTRTAKPKVHIESDLLSTSEVARKLRVDHSTVLRWIYVGALEAIELPHKRERTVYRIRRQTIDAMLAEKGA